MCQLIDGKKNRVLQLEMKMFDLEVVVVGFPKYEINITINNNNYGKYNVFSVPYSSQSPEGVFISNNVASCFKQLPQKNYRKKTSKLKTRRLLKRSASLELVDIFTINRRAARS